MAFLDDLALAHQEHEGWYPGSRSYRNNNPGNLRNGPPSDRDGFTVYPTYRAGFDALKADLRAKLTGKSVWIDYSKNPTFLDYVKVYAPKDDGNDPNGYAQALIRDLQQYHITLSTPLSDLAKLINPPAPKPEDLVQQTNAMPEPVRTRLLRRIISILPKAAGDRLRVRLSLPPAP